MVTNVTQHFHGNRLRYNAWDSETDLLPWWGLHLASHHCANHEALWSACLMALFTLKTCSIPVIKHLLQNDHHPEPRLFYILSKSMTRTCWSFTLSKFLLQTIFDQRINRIENVHWLKGNLRSLLILMQAFETRPANSSRRHEEEVKSLLFSAAFSMKYYAISTA